MSPILRTSRGVLLGLLICLLSRPGLASELKLDDSRHQGQLLSLGIELSIDGEPLNALHHGVALPFAWRLRSYDGRWWLPGRTVAEGRWSIAYEPLSKRYTLTVDEQARSFRTLEEVLSALRQATVNLAEDTGTSALQLRAQLDISSLPPPMRITSYLSPEWRLDTGWRAVRP